MNRSNANNIVLWTLEPKSVWEALQKQGYLANNSESAQNYPYDELIQAFPYQYQWLREQVVQRLPGYSHPEYYPWAGPVVKPDLRYERHHLDPPGPWVRLKLSIPRERVLYYNHGEWWTGVLNRHYIDRSGEAQEEANQWDAEREKAGFGWFFEVDQLPPDLRDRLLASWERIFDVEGMKPEWIWGLFEQLNLSDVVEVTEFTSCTRERVTPPHEI